MRKLLIAVLFLFIFEGFAISGELQTEFANNLNLEKLNKREKLKFLKYDYSNYLAGKYSFYGQVKKDFDIANPTHKPTKEPNILYLVQIRTNIKNAINNNKIPEYINVSDKVFSQLFDNVKKDICKYNLYTNAPENIHFAQQEFEDTVRQDEKEFLNMVKLGGYHDITFSYLLTKYIEATYNLNAKYFEKTDIMDNYYKNNWVGLHLTEGEYYYVPNYKYIRKKYNKYLSPAYREWLKYLAENQFIIEDAGLAIPVDELRKRIIYLENFIEKNSNFADLHKVKDELNLYLRIYLLGIDNTPIFDRLDTKKMCPEFKSSYEKFLQKNMNSKYYLQVETLYNKAKENNFTWNENFSKWQKDTLKIDE